MMVDVIVDNVKTSFMDYNQIVIIYIMIYPRKVKWWEVNTFHFLLLNDDLRIKTIKRY